MFVHKVTVTMLLCVLGTEGGIVSPKPSNTTQSSSEAILITGAINGKQSRGGPTIAEHPFIIFHEHNFFLSKSEFTCLFLLTETLIHYF